MWGGCRARRGAGLKPGLRGVVWGGVEACATFAERQFKQSLALTHDCYMLIQIVVSGQVDGSQFLDS